MVFFIKLLLPAPSTQDFGIRKEDLRKENIPGTDF